MSFVDGHVSPLTFESKASSGFITLARADTKKPCTFFILENPSIGGYSGCAIYDTSIYKHGTSVTTGGGTICYGFMHGTIFDDTGGKLAMVTPSHYLFDFFDKVNEQTINNSASPGRNSPCSCGSQKKYKHCHGQL